MLRFSDNQLSIKEIYLSGIKAYKAVYSKVWIIVLINALLSGLTLLIINHYLPPSVPQNAMAVKTAAATATTAAVAPVSPHFTAVLLLNAALVLIATYLYAVLLHQIYFLIKGEETALQKSLSIALYKYPIIIIASIISLILAGIGFIALVIPGVYVYILLLFATPFILFDNKNIFSSIKASAKLVWGNWLRTFLVLLPLTFIVIALSLFANSIAHGNTAVFVILNMLSSLFIFPFYPIFILYLFNDLKVRKGMVVKAA